MKKWILNIGILAAVCTLGVGHVRAADYYMSPTGVDTNPGTSQSSPIATFVKAWQLLRAGDTLYLLDGTYYQPMQPTINGQAGNPITIKALNDGKVRIDGQGIRHTVVIGNTWDTEPRTNGLSTINRVGNYFTIEGLIAMNSVDDVYELYGHDITVRRCSGYNANTRDNNHVFTVWSLGSQTRPSNILLEDNIAAGSGRKMMVAYESYVNITFRRNFAAWQSWHGDNFCNGNWPQSDGIEIYPAPDQNQPDVLNNSFLENNILFGLVPNYGFSLNPNPGNSIGNNFLGDMAIGIGMKWDNAQHKFVLAPYNQATCTYNGITMPTSCGSKSCISFKNSDLYRAGFVIASHCSQNNYVTKNNTLQDIFAYNGASVGLVSSACGQTTNRTNNKLTRATIVNNGNDWNGTNAESIDLGSFIITDSKIAGTAYNGGGAQIQNRYVNGSVTTQSLWPWPMEDRIKTELADATLFQANGVQGQVWTDFSVTQNVCEDILKPNGAASNCGLTPASGVPSPSPKPGDADGNGKVDGMDYVTWFNHYNQVIPGGNTVGDFNTSGKVDGADYTIWFNNYGK